METLSRIGCRGLIVHHRALWPSPQPLSARKLAGKLPLYSEGINSCSHLQLRTRAVSSQGGGQGSPVRAVPVQVAHELLNAGHRYLDVRTTEEFASGHVDGAVNVPYMYKATGGMTKNLKFLEDVSEKFGKDDEIVVGCQMGKRSNMAAGELIAAGFTGITDMTGGYISWVQSGKPSRSN